MSEKIYWILTKEEIKSNVNLKNILWIVLMLLLAFSTTNIVHGYTYYEEFSHNEAGFPLGGVTQEYQFPFLANQTLFFVQEERQDDKVFLDFPSQFTHTNNTNGYIFKINYTLLDRVYSESTSFNVSVKVTNSKNNQSATIGMKFNIEKTALGAIQVIGTDELVIENGTYVKRITQDKLPSAGNLSFNVVGEPNEFFTLQGCTSLLKCPLTQYKFDAQGHKTIFIDYSLPITQALGRYTEHFNLVSGSRNSTVNVRFDISTPRLLTQPLELDPQCTSDAPFDIQAKCYQKLAEYNLEIVTNFNKYLTEINIDDVCKDYRQIEYVIGDSYPEEVVETNKQLRNENADLRTKLDLKNEELLNCKDEQIQQRDNFQKTINEKEEEKVALAKESVKSEYAKDRQTEIEKAEFREKYGGKIKWLLFIATAIPFGLIIYSEFVRHKSLRRSNMPTDILFIIMIVFLVCWLASLIFI